MLVTFDSTVNKWSQLLLWFHPNDFKHYLHEGDFQHFNCSWAFFNGSPQLKFSMSITEYAIIHQNILIGALYLATLYLSQPANHLLLLFLSRIHPINYCWPSLALVSSRPMSTVSCPTLFPWKPLHALLSTAARIICVKLSMVPRLLSVASEALHFLPLNLLIYIYPLISLFSTLPWLVAISWHFIC